MRRIAAGLLAFLPVCAQAQQGSVLDDQFHRIPMNAPNGVPMLDGAGSLGGQVVGGRPLSAIVGSFGQPGGPALLGASTTLPYGIQAIPVTQRAPTPKDDASRGFVAGNFWQANNTVWQYQTVAGRLTWVQVATAGQLPLDAVTGAAAAYGTVKLRAAYTGAAFHLVSPTDSTGVDVGFLASGVLDTATRDAYVAAQAAAGQKARVSIWYDQSGNARNATSAYVAGTPAQPTVSAPNQLGSSAPLVWDDTNGTNSNQQTLTLPTSVTFNGNGVSVFGALRFVNAWQNIPFFEGSSANGGPPMVGGLLNRGAAQQPSLNLLYGNSNALGIQPPSTPILFGWVSSPSATTIYGDNASGSYAGIGNVLPMAGGQIGYSPTENVSGGLEASAFLLYASSLTSAQATAVQASLLRATGITPQVRGRVVIDGDSIAAGAYMTANRDFARMAEEQMPPVRVYNEGVPGQGIVDRLAAYPIVTAPLYDPTAPFNVLVQEASTNDITLNNTSATALYGLLQQYCAAARATGFKIVLTTTLPRGTMTAAQEAQRQVYLGLVRAGWRGFADALVDWAADPTMGPVTATADTTLYADTIHPYDLGYQYLAPALAAALTPLAR